MNYFKASQTKGFSEQLDSWVRRHLRKIKWRQWKRRWTRLQELLKRGIGEQRAVQSVFNQRGPWWNAGASHLNQALPKQYFESLGLVSMAQILRQASR